MGRAASLFYALLDVLRYDAGQEDVDSLAATLARTYGFLKTLLRYQHEAYEKLSPFELQNKVWRTDYGRIIIGPELESAAALTKTKAHIAHGVPDPSTGWRRKPSRYMVGPQIASGAAAILETQAHPTRGPSLESCKAWQSTLGHDLVKPVSMLATAFSPSLPESSSTLSKGLPDSFVQSTMDESHHTSRCVHCNKDKSFFDTPWMSTAEEIQLPHPGIMSAYELKSTPKHTSFMWDLFSGIAEKTHRYLDVVGAQGYAHGQFVAQNWEKVQPGISNNDFAIQETAIGAFQAGYDSEQQRSGWGWLPSPWAIQRGMQAGLLAGRAMMDSALAQTAQMAGDEESQRHLDNLHTDNVANLGFGQFVNSFSHAWNNTGVSKYGLQYVAGHYAQQKIKGALQDWFGYSTSTPQACTDANRGCAAWVKMDYCSNFHTQPWMAAHCPCACKEAGFDFSGSDGKAAATTTTTTTAGDFAAARPDFGYIGTPSADNGIPEPYAIPDSGQKRGTTEKEVKGENKGKIDERRLIDLHDWVWHPDSDGPLPKDDVSKPSGDNMGKLSEFLNMAASALKSIAGGNKDPSLSDFDKEMLNKAEPIMAKHKLGAADVDQEEGGQQAPFWRCVPMAQIDEHGPEVLAQTGHALVNMQALPNGKIGIVVPNRPPIYSPLVPPPSWPSKGMCPRGVEGCYRQILRDPNGLWYWVITGKGEPSIAEEAQSKAYTDYSDLPARYAYKTGSNLVCHAQKNPKHEFDENPMDASGVHAMDAYDIEPENVPHLPHSLTSFLFVRLPRAPTEFLAVGHVELNSR